MNKLISLELKRNSLRPYHIAVMISAAAMLMLLYLLAAIPKIDPTETDIEIVTAYSSLFEIINIVSMTVFSIISAVMSSKLIVEEYSGKRALLLFLYPLPRKKIFGAKIVLVFLYTTVAMFLCSILIQLIFLLTENIFHICSDHLTISTMLTAILSLACHSIFAGMLGVLSVWFGFIKKSISVTIVSAVILAAFSCQLMVALISFSQIIFVLIMITGLITIMATSSLFSKVENAEA